MTLCERGENVNVTSYVFIDRSIQDYQNLLASVKPGYQTVLLDSDRDGIVQISEVLQKSQEVAEVHLVAHGSPGYLYLGNTRLDLTHLGQHAEYLQQWRKALVRCADILLYGCYVAEQKWEELLQPLHAITGANIAASSREVGQGRWDLDQRIGEVTATLAFTPELQQSYAGTFDIAYLLSNQTIIPFDTNNPSTLNPAISVTGIAAGENLVGIDFRPQNGKLYGLAFNSSLGSAQLYAISTQTGVATAVGTLGTFSDAGGTPVAIAGPDLGLDFNPTVDRVRVVTSGGQNFRINPNNGAAVDGNAVAAGVQQDGNINGGTTVVDATAYTNNSPNVGTTTQYALDAISDTLFIQNPPNNGTQTAPLPVTLGGSPLDFTAINGFDIPAGVNVATANTPATGQAFSALTVGGVTELYAIELSTGVATRVGTIGTGTTPVQGFAIQNQASEGTPIVGLTTANSLVRFSSNSPGTATTVAIAGLTAGETLVGIDYRPATGQLFGLGVNDATNTGTAYIIDPQTGAATLVGAAAGQITFVDATGAPVDLPAAGNYGFDFNPTVDRIRVVTNSGLNFRLNPITGAPADGDLGGAVGSVAGTNPDGSINSLPTGSTGVDAAAYTNSFAGATATTQYTLDSTSNSLLIQNPPNSGTQTSLLPVTLNGTPLDFTAVSGFDIPSGVRVAASNAAASGQALAALSVGGTTGLYGINLSTGVATSLGTVGGGTTSLVGLAVGEVAAGITTNFATNGGAVVTATSNSNQNFVQFSLLSKQSDFGTNEFVAFTVDDDLGTINGIAPGAAGYLDAAIARASVIFSTLDDEPTGFGGTRPSTLDFGTNTRFSTFLIQDGTLDELQAGRVDTSSVLFSNQTSVRVSDAVGTGFTYSFEDDPAGGGNDFSAAVLRVSTVGQNAVNGSTLQAQGQSELLDLRSLTGQTNATFTVNREADFDNIIGFYRVVDQNGGIDTNNDGTVDILTGAAGYTDAAIRNRVSELSVADQQTATFTGQLTGGAIFAPFIIADGTVDQVLNGQNLNQVYFPFLGANADQADHIRLLGNNTFGFEDLPSGGDKDFNDIIVQITI